jgi:hypothetical protein
MATCASAGCREEASQGGQSEACPPRRTLEQVSDEVGTFRFAQPTSELMSALRRARSHAWNALEKQNRRYRFEALKKQNR